jgi:hypothetical protein
VGVDNQPFLKCSAQLKPDVSTFSPRKNHNQM